MFKVFEFEGFIEYFKEKILHSKYFLNNIFSLTKYSLIFLNKFPKDNYLIYSLSFPLKSFLLPSITSSIIFPFTFQASLASYHGLLAGIHYRHDKLRNVLPELHNESGV